MRASIERGEHRHALRKGLGILGAALLTMAITNEKQNHSPPERVYAQSIGPPVVLRAFPSLSELNKEPSDILPIEPPTTTTVAPPPTTEAQPLPTPDTAPPDTAPPDTVAPEQAPPPDPNQWQAPEGCLAPMGPQEGKSVDEAHRCWDGLLALYGWPQDQAFNVMYCESKGNPYADNPSSTAEGLMQVLDGSTDPRTNMDQAHAKYEAGHWRPWVCSPYDNP